MVKKVISIILSILIFLFALLSLTSALLKFDTGNYDRLKNNILTEDYLDALYSDVKYDVEGECIILEVDSETVMSYINKDNLRDISEKFLKNDYEVVFKGAEIENIRYELDGLKDEIYAELSAFAQDQEIVDEDVSLAVSETYDVIMDSVNDTIHYFTGGDLEKASVVSHIPALGFLTGVGFYVFVVLFLICCVLKVFVMKSIGTLRAFYNIFFMSWLASAVFFFPLLVLKIEDIPSKIMIEYSGFRIWSQNLINAVINPAFTLALIVFIVCTLGVLAFLIFTLFTVHKRMAVEADSTSENADS